MIAGTYSWLLFAHIASVAGFRLAHGTSAAMAFRLRSEKTTDGIRSLAELSKQTSGLMDSFLVLIVMLGVFLGFQGGGEAVTDAGIRVRRGSPVWAKRERFDSQLDTAVE
jgi:hypothetical protein